MIIEWIMELSAGFLGWMASLAPEIEQIPDDVTDPLGPLVEAVAGTGHWVDWLSIGVIVGVVTSLWLIAFGLKFARALAAHIPFVGGNG